MRVITLVARALQTRLRDPKTVALLVVLAVAVRVHGQAGWAKPAFAGQTNAPKPSKLSPPFTVETVTNRLSGPWSIAFLPSGNFLITEANGTMRVARPDGSVSAPLSGVPGVKSVAAQGLHDLLLDPDFARNRTLYFTYFAPPKGEAPAVWPIEFFYERVWTKPLAERRTMQIGMETVARGRLAEDERSLTDVETIAEGAERRIVLARDGTLLITGADRFRFYDSDLDGVNHDFTDNPDVRRNFSGRVLRINRDGSIPKETSSDIEAEFRRIRSVQDEESFDKELYKYCLFTYSRKPKRD